MISPAVELETQYGYWGEHPDYPVRDWQIEVMNDYTRNSYWEWVANNLTDRDL